MYLLHDDDSTFIDYSSEANDYLVDDLTVTLIALEDYLYIAHPDDKIIAKLYIELSDPNENANTFTAEYYNGSAWASLESSPHSRARPGRAQPITTASRVY